MTPPSQPGRIPPAAVAVIVVVVVNFVVPDWLPWWQDVLLAAAAFSIAFIIDRSRQ